MDNKYEDKSSCAKRKCEHWKNRMCVDSTEHRINGTGELCCRYHSEAIATNEM